MAYQDLRDYLRTLESKGLLKRIKTEVSADLEITEISDRVVKAGGPTLLFENVRGYQMPVVTNLMGTLEHMKLALQVDDLDDIGRQMLEFLQPPELPTGFIDKLKALPKLAQLSSFLPKIVRTGPCKEVVIKDKPSLAALPVLKCWPQDGGPFITLPLVFTKDPETGRRNVGMYRMQVYDEITTGMHWHMHKDGAENHRKQKRQNKPLEVAVALGADPACIFSAVAPLPPGIDEMLLAGFLRKEPVELVKCETVDIEVPARAEIILEGYVDPEETRLEGPFGDHTGYYSLADYYPVFHLTCITHRKNPIYPATIVGKPPIEDNFIGKAIERTFLPLLKLQLPEIVDMNMPPEGVFHNCVIVSIKKRYPGHAKKVMSALWGMGQMMFAKLIIVVDDHVNVQNPSEVAWRVFNNIDPRRDVMMVDGPLDALDHSSPMPFYGSKMGIDATKKWPAEGHNREWPDDIEMSEEIKSLVDRKWQSYGF
ncbi:menaquinone biosynthesis decarboxylase, SCO4490 family [Desulfotomaculum nigrificans CO-1-SRB]|uniref:Menaquinone biosynthesis decarboxylase, SCO4490 family n=1 Tax=Desulfotomaculum nigrificans (strain DSM 14880 / VKM B-2319 / CO-1-SRB) TaxID=868595 RepID=F6B716_DESCC|nr:menaquinone biosynthesis decarboxylase [Desulfotomaculum nigrificans]AEF94441.1 menaquinone biosynthesis decarboxylase, SCO4490 family [Desulfotomaculum nigrificans CO-1-SRB]